LPDEIETYTHRSGRTGRAGKLGTSIIFVTKSDRRKIRLIENKLQTKLTELEMPSAQEIFKNKVQHWIEEIKNTPVKSELQPYFADTHKGLEELDKETLVELLLSKEFRNFDVYPKSLSFDQEKNSERRSDKKINAPKDKDRFFINLGARDQYEWTTLKDFIRSYLKLGMDDVFQVEVMKNFSFFSTHKKHRDLVLRSFENLNLDSRKISVELTKKGKTFSPGKKKKKSNYAVKSKKRFK